MPAPTRVVLLAIPISIGTLSIFLLRRLDKGEWDFGEPIVAVFIAVALLAPGLVFLVALVRSAALFFVGLLALCVSTLIGIGLAAAAGGDGQAGLNLFATPAIALGATLLLGWIDRGQRSVDDARADHGGLGK